MKVIADFEVRSELMVPEGDGSISWTHPRLNYECRLQRIPGKSPRAAPLLSLHLIYDTPSLEEAEDIGTDLLIDAMNYLCLVTGCTVEFHRLIQIFEWSTAGGMHNGLLFAKQSLDDNWPTGEMPADISATLALLQEAKVSDRLANALRWFRLGVASTALDEQFQQFWFALELAALDAKNVEPVHDLCAKCRKPLYCETCQDHPKHRPYPKQAIAEVVTSIAPKLDFGPLNTARNALMHGDRLDSVAHQLPVEPSRLVDIFGHLVRDILVRAISGALPTDAAGKSAHFLKPNTFLHFRMGAAAAIQAGLGRRKNGEPDLGGAPKASFVSAPVNADGEVKWVALLWDSLAKTNLVATEAKRSWQQLSPAEQRTLKNAFSEAGMSMDSTGAWLN